MASACFLVIGCYFSTCILSLFRAVVLKNSWIHTLPWIKDSDPYIAVAISVDIYLAVDKNISIDISIHCR